MRRGGRAGEVVDAVNLSLEGVNDIVTEELETRVAEEVSDVGFAPGKEVVHAKDIMTFIEKAFAEMGAEETGPAGDEYSHSLLLVKES